MTQTSAYGTSSLAGAWSAVAPPTGGVRKCRAWSPWMLPQAGVVGHGPWMVAPLSYGCSSERAGVVGHGPWSVAPLSYGCSSEHGGRQWC